MRALLIALALPAIAAGASAQERTFDAPFRPRLVKAEMIADKVRPGDSLPVTLRFVNDGTAPAAGVYRVFVHCEPERDCSTIAFGNDHAPALATTAWKPGKEVVDGPFAVAVPPDAVPGSYWLHVGVYLWEPQHVRFCEQYVGQFQVSRSAPAIRDTRPPLPAEEVARRRAALDALPAGAVSLESAAVRFSVDPATGAWSALDKATRVTWHSRAQAPRFGEAAVRVGERRETLSLEAPAVRRDGEELVLAFRGKGEPRSAGAAPADTAAVEVRVSLPEVRTLQLTYAPGAGTQIESIRLLDDALWVTDADPGFVIMPTREGMLVPADSGKMFERSFPTSAYEGCHMEMFGVLKQGAAAMVTWDDPYVTAELRSALTEDAAIPGRQVLSASLLLRKTAKTAQIHFLGRGDIAAIAHAYREVARKRGLLQTWDEKIARNPDAAKLIGAADVKLWSTLSRSMGDDGKERSARVNWTFDEAAQVAEHLKNDLKIDRVLFTMGGWIHRGYDNQHPDVLPTAPECGGDAKFTDACRRIRATGYLLGLHDNYQDIYRDSPSWDESLIMKDARGNLVKGGKWAGGQAWLTCSKQALMLAKRPQNLPAVRKLSGPAAYFIDTTFAVGPQECYAPEHPLTYTDDIKYKCDLSDYARGVFGLFGSECGREWALPHADFFEGYTGVSGGYYHDKSLPGSLGATVIPFFEMVYRDCIAAYGKYGYDPTRAASYVLHHLVIGRPLNYHSIPSHLYWKEAALAGPTTLPVAPGVASVEPAGPRAFRITYAWKVDGPVGGDWKAFVHFTDPAGKILFQDDYQPEPATSRWQAGEVRVGPHAVLIPEGLNGPFFVQMGLFRPNPEVRARLKGTETDANSYRTGSIRLENGTVRFQPAGAAPADEQAPAADPGCFARADGGWAEGMCVTDRFLKNTQEVLGPLNEITARMLVTKLDFLTPDRRAQRATFGKDVRVSINDRPDNLTIRRGDDKEVVLPPYGFLVEAPEFVAFHALNWGSVRYDKPVLFTIRSLDGKPLATSKRIRVFHAFGDARLDLGGRVVTVAKESIVQ